jgi:putative peptidoglycan lipid II flippase
VRIDEADPGSGGRGAGGSGVLRAAGAMGLATFFSRILGLIREQVFAYLFGAGNATDAFNVAFRIPNLLRDLFAEGAMSSSLVPTFTQARENEGERRAWRVAGLVFRLLALIVAGLAGLGILFAPQLVSLYASAFHQVPGKFELTLRMTRVMFPFFPLVAVAAAYMGILNACGVFFLPAFSSALFNLASITVGVAFAVGSRHFPWILPWGGANPIEGMALGVVAGGAVQAFCQLPALYRAGYRWERARAGDPPWHRDPALRRILWLMVPGTIGLAATQINILVNTILATSQGTGAVSWLNYAFRLMQFPIGIFGVSLAAATLPRVSTQWVRGDLAGVQATLTRSLSQVFAINLPASAGLAFLGFPIIELIFQYGRFQASDTRATALALAMYSVGLTAYSAVKVLVPACYALGNTRIPVLSSVLAVLMTISLNLLTVRQFGYWGLALGTSLAAVFNAAFLVFAIRSLMREARGEFPARPLLRSLLQHGAIALGMGVLCWASYRGLLSVCPDVLFLRLFGAGAGWGRAGVPLVRGIRLGLLILEGGIFALLAAKALGARETLEVLDLFTEKLKKKLRRGRN